MSSMLILSRSTNSDCSTNRHTLNGDILLVLVFSALWQRSTDAIGSGSGCHCLIVLTVHAECQLVTLSVGCLCWSGRFVLAAWHTSQQRVAKTVSDMRRGSCLELALSTDSVWSTD